MTRGVCLGGARCAALPRLAVLASLLVCSSCTAPRSTAYSTFSTDRQAAADRARLANARGLECVDRGDLAAARRSFRESLSFDPGYASAHNNLGLVLLQQGRCYDAAVELVMAQRLAPRSIEPRINLGRLYERVGWIPAAMEQYENALAIDSGHPETLGHLAALSIASGRNRPELSDWLAVLAAQAADRPWQSWAAGQLAHMQAREPAN